MENEEKPKAAPTNKEKLFSNWKYLAIHLGAIALLTLVVLVFIVSTMDPPNRPFAQGFVLLVAVSFMYGIIARHISPKAKDRNPNTNPYHGYFFKGTVTLTTLLVLFGIFGAFFVYVEHDNLFQAVGLATSVIWIAVFLIYFMWSVYHYNINYGLTDQDWERIYEAKDRYRQGLPVKPSELQTPEYNPYRSQTFGLPPGTVRGMIAFTLLMGGMSLLITSFGSPYTGGELALIRQQFEFFETAFLMMIAFYFGDKSLKHLRGRWTDPNSRQVGSVDRQIGPSATKSPSSVKTSWLDQEDEYFLQEDREFDIQESQDNVGTLSERRKMLSASLEQPEEVLGTHEEYVQVKDNTASKVLSDMDIRIALDELEQKENIKISMPVIKAIVTVESAGRGHLKDGRAKILFEGHKFWYWLEKFGKDPKTLQKGKEHIIYPKWTREHYRVGAGEYDRLDEAKQIDAKAAVYAASWGLFQILGENLEHFIKGRKYKDHVEFEAKQHASECFHFLDFLEFIKTKKVRGKPLISYVSEDNAGQYDWESFAFGYNGSGYKVNKYDVKLKAAYEKYKAMES